jgi:uncharacterized protein YdeI (YjbR/CyaY-like superfamily)
VNAASKADLPVAAFATQADWNAWLAGQPKVSLGVWVKFAKKAWAVSTVSKQDAIDAAFCHGWIDGQLNKFDVDYFLIRFTPRMARSSWSQINRTCALALMAQGRVQPAGLADIKRAQADGRWNAAYALQSKAELPGDLQAALDADKNAASFFATFNRVNRYAILDRLHEAVNSETRARKLA